MGKVNTCCPTKYLYYREKVQQIALLLFRIFYQPSIQLKMYLDILKNSI